MFRTAFDEALGKTRISLREKLHYLHQYTRGTARESVESCLYEGGNGGYDRAWQMLNRRFGNIEVVRCSYLANLLSHGDVGRGDGSRLVKAAY